MTLIRAIVLFSLGLLVYFFSYQSSDVAVYAQGGAADEVGPQEPVPPPVPPTPPVKPDKFDTAVFTIINTSERIPPPVTASKISQADPLSSSLLQSGLLRVDDSGRLQVNIRLSHYEPEIFDWLEDLGVTVERTSPDITLLQARVPLRQIKQVAALEYVSVITAPKYGFVNVGSKLTEGDSLLKLSSLRSSLGVNGSGITVGVISDGIFGLANAIASGDLPATTFSRDGSGRLLSTSGGVIATSFRADGDLEGGLGASPGPEGTAILEIVHDIAPGAQLRFANFDTALEFMAAVDFLASVSDIVIDDIGFSGGPYDQTSDVSVNTAAELNRSSNRIRGYYTSVGNEANKHYQAMYRDSGVSGQPFVGVGGNLHRFQSGDGTACYNFDSSIANAILLAPGQSTEVFLTWDDAFGATTTDYDLYLLQDSDARVVMFSVDDNRGVTKNPTERLSFTNTTSTDKFYDILIQNFNNESAAKSLELFVHGGVPCAQRGTTLNFNTEASSVPAQSDAGGGVVSVGAVDASAPGMGDIEPFSSRGPTNNGVVKPDVAAMDGVSVTGSGGFSSTFFGTSAAAPHVAGMAALLLQAHPQWKHGELGDDPVADRAALRAKILNSSDDLGASGVDNVFGAGRINGLNAAAGAGTVTLSKPFIATTGTLTVTVADADLNVGVEQTAEASDADATTYSFPFTAGNDAGLTKQVQVKKVPILDRGSASSATTPDGIVNFSDVIVSHVDLQVISVDPNNGLVTVRAKTGEATGAAAAYTLTYKAADVQFSSVKITSTQDPAGFTLRVKESNANSGSFTSTFNVGALTKKTFTDVLGASPATIDESDGVDLNGNGTLNQTALAGPFNENTAKIVNLDGTFTTGVDLNGNGIATDTSVARGDVQVDLFPSFATRPTIQVTAGSTITARDTDVDPAGTRTSSSTVESTKPVFTLVEPAQSSVRGNPINVKLAADVTDADSGLDTTTPTLRFYVKIGSNWLQNTSGTLGSPGSPVAITPTITSITGGLRGELVIGNVGTGETAIQWWTLATDKAGNTGVSDTDTASTSVCSTTSFVSEATAQSTHKCDPYNTKVDTLAPVLTITVSVALSKTSVTITVTSNEALVIQPTITVSNQTNANGATGSATNHTDASLVATNTYQKTFSTSTSPTGNNVKNVQATGTDLGNNTATAGKNNTKTAGAVTFEIDANAPANPIITPNADIATRDPFISIAWSGEGTEYIGDTRKTVTMTKANLQALDSLGATTSTTDILADLVTSDNVTYVYATKGLALGKYRLVVAATDEAGNASGDITGATWSVTKPPPSWPAGSTLSTSNVTGTGLTLTWTAAVDDIIVAAYRIYLDSVLLATVNGSTLSYNVTGLTPGIEYPFKVEAGDAAGNFSSDGPKARARTAFMPVAVPSTGGWGITGGAALMLLLILGRVYLHRWDRVGKTG